MWTTSSPRPPSGSTRHFHMAYEARSEDGELLLSGTTVQVMYDYDAGASTRMSDPVRSAIEALDGPFAPGGMPADDPSSEP